MGFDPNAFTQATNFLNNLNPQRHEILTVNSLQQAKDFVMNRGDSYLLLDPNSDILYIKEKDTIGKEKLSVYRLTNCTDEFINNSTPVTISKTDYEKLLNRLAKLEERNAASKSEQPELDFTDK